ncbi:MAG TPA: DnaJ domain-containing protein [Spirochaetia bacterium]|nr:DnaJ domain-containing protein [Spirochaetia bacterium]
MAIHVSEQHFREILGVTGTATQEEIKQAYRRLVMENHPDRFPSEKKALQELTTITLTEAYTALMSALTMREEHAAPVSPSGRESRSPPPSSMRRENRPAPPAGPGLTAHRDPSYAYYKQGFINFSLAIHGIAEINRKIAAGRVPHFTRRYTAAEDIAGSLGFLQAAYGYFSRVVEDHPDSVWSADSRAKLRRIDRFTLIYRRILENLKRR